MTNSNPTVLVVDDEPAVLDTAREGLHSLGYQVLTASDGEQALHVASAHGGPIAVLLIDVVMAMPGPEIAQRVREIRPDIKVLFMSGFSSEITIVHGVNDGDPFVVNRSVSTH